MKVIIEITIPDQTKLNLGRVKFAEMLDEFERITKTEYWYRTNDQLEGIQIAEHYGKDD